MFQSSGQRRRGLRRVFLMLFPVLLFCFGMTAADAAPIEVVNCGVHVLHAESLGELPEQGLRRTTMSGLHKSATINLTPGPNLLADTTALAAYQQAITIWEGLLQDNVTLAISGDLVPLASGVLGTTSSRVFLNDFDLIRDAVVADADAGEPILASMPALAQFSVEIPSPPFSYNGRLKGTKANFRALGFDMSFDDPNPDATINFSTTFPFDFDPSDGITAGSFDFEAVVVHELGHALGFISEIDSNEADIVNGTPAPEVAPSVLDLFRLRLGTGATHFTTAPRVASTGAATPMQVFYDGLMNLQLSTGVTFGDGRQAGHWKADEFTGTNIGIMDPSLVAGQRSTLSENDLRAFGLMGWDIAVAPVAAEDVRGSASRMRVRASPNPFNPRTTVRFELAAPGFATVEVFNVVGRRVASLLRRALPAGAHELTWDGRGEGGRVLASGVYVVAVEANSVRREVSVVLVK